MVEPNAAPTKDLKLKELHFMADDQTIPEKEKHSENKSRYHVPNLERALEVFELLSKNHEGLTQTEIAEALNIPRNSVFRITITLANLGYLFRDDISKKFTLTPKLIQIGYAGIGEANLVEKSIDIMKRLRNEIDETIMLGAFVQNEGIILEVFTGGGLPFKLTVDPGSKFKLYCSAPGKAILYHLPDHERQEVLNSLPYEVHTKNTITSPEDLLGHIENWGKKGYFIDNEEEFNGLRCVGTAILNRYGYPVAGLWTAGPIDRFPMSRIHELGAKLKSFALIISQRMGFLE